MSKTNNKVGEEEIRTQSITDVEWYDSMNVGLTDDLLRPVYKYRPPSAFPVLYNPNTRERVVITSHFLVGWDTEIKDSHK